MQKYLSASVLFYLFFAILLVGCQISGIANVNATLAFTPTSNQSITPSPSKTPTLTMTPFITPTSIFCGVQAKEFIENVREKRLELADAVKLIENTPRSLMGDRISELQAIKRESDSIPYPSCAFALHSKLLGLEDAYIQIFMNFFSQGIQPSIFDSRMAQLAEDGLTEELSRVSTDLEITLTPKP